MTIRKLTAVVLFAGLIAGAFLLSLRLVRPPRAKAQSGCSAATIQGTFGYTFSGLGGGVPLAGAGAVTFDGTGNSQGADWISINGIPRHRTYSGTYSVNADCTGSSVYTDDLGGIFHESGVVMNGGNQIAVDVTDNGAVFAFTETRE